MKILAIITLALMLAVPVIAYDQREGNNAIPMLPPDPSLKTTDAFYGGQPASALDPVYQLPPIFGGAAPVIMLAPPDWMDLSSHNAKMNATNQSTTAANSFELTATQMKDVPLGSEQWL